PLAYVLQIYATFFSQEFNQFLRGAYGINNLSKSLHSTPRGGTATKDEGESKLLEIQFLCNAVTFYAFPQRCASHAQKLGRLHLIAFCPLHCEQGEFALQPGKQLEPVVAGCRVQQRLHRNFQRGSSWICMDGDRHLLLHLSVLLLS